ncbi:MAG: hypothetical protein GXY67_07895 [Clostridiales bacterium]|nr:hypothetical protein [Clostridiales bacterium]
MLIGKWAGFQFTVSSSLVNSFESLSIKSSCEEKTQNAEEKARKKSSQITFTVHLLASLGVDVQSEVQKYLNAVKKETSGHFYVAGKKVLSDSLTLTDANVTDVRITPAGKWASAKVQLTMKFSQSFGGVPEGGGGTTRKKSKKISVSDGAGGYTTTTVADKNRGDRENSAFWSTQNTISAAKTASKKK